MLNISPIPIYTAGGIAPGPYLVQAEAPEGYPVTLDEAKAYLRVDGSDEDAVIAGMLAAACDHIQMQTGRALGMQKWELHLDHFPEVGPNGRGMRFIDIPFPPCVSVDEIAYRTGALDDPPIWTPIDPADYTVELPIGPLAVPARAFPVSNGNAWWPLLGFYWDDAVRVSFTAGYPLDTATPPATILPPPLKQAILLTLNDFYCNRGGTSAKQLYANPAVEALIGSYRVWAF
jgi:uncharacterized phiE125 gp8 family phage protein